jgi:hypothetical protein
VLGYEGGRVTESFRYTPSNPTDIVFVVETSPSLQDALDASGPAQDVFVETLRSTNVDYHLTSLSTGDVCPANSYTYATRSDSSLQTSTVLSRGFAGDHGAWDDDLLGLVLLALEEGDPGECLEGFRRSDADLYIVLITDGPPDADVDGQVAQLVLEGSLRVSALLPSGGCGARALDYEAVIDATGGTLADLCAAEWSESFGTFATLPAGADPVSFPLAELPVPSSIEIVVEGKVFVDWTYDSVENVVRFSGAVVPALGAEVVIQYVLAVACE